MPDIYLYDDAPVLRNKLQIKNEKMLELIEAKQCINIINYTDGEIKSNSSEVWKGC